MFKNVLPRADDSFGTAENPYAAPRGSSVVVTDTSSLGVRAYRVDLDRERVLARRLFGIIGVAVLGACALILAFFYVSMGHETKRVSIALLAAPGVVIATICVAYVLFLRNRFRNGLEIARSFVLEIGDGVVRRSAKSMATVSLRREEVRSILQFTNGGFVLVGPTPQTSVTVPATLVGRDDVFEVVRAWAPTKAAQNALDRVLLGVFLLACVVKHVTPAFSLLCAAANVVVASLSIRTVWKAWRSPVLATWAKLVATLGMTLIVVSSGAYLVWFAWRLTHE